MPKPIKPSPPKAPIAAPPAEESFDLFGAILDPLVDLLDGFPDPIAAAPTEVIDDANRTVRPDESKQAVGSGAAGTGQQPIINVNLGSLFKSKQPKPGADPGKPDIIPADPPPAA